MSGENSSSFWTTLPGILTGLAALITAIGGIWLIYDQVVNDGNEPEIDNQGITGVDNPQVDDQGTTGEDEPVHQVTNGVIENSTEVTVDEPILSAPEQVSPADGTVFDEYPNEITLEWTEVPGATIYGVEVEVYLGYWGNVITSYVTTNSYTFSSPGTYPGRWRVWTVDSMDRKSEKSDWWGYSYTT
ncbi:hypothetical protein [Methanosarcina sp.]|uniref:hypothetical protein n=1 Tax=Methanosarcina sp. TaxID=2213 RepID=UPI003C79523A